MRMSTNKTSMFAMACALSLTLAACGGSSSSASSASASADTSSASSSAATTQASAAAMSYAEYAAAAIDDPVTIEAYVQGKQSWWDNKATIYAQDKDGGYFIYNAVCPESDYAKLTDGVKIKVSGYKAEWSGEVEVAEGATIEVVDDGDTFVADPVDVTSMLGTDALIEHQNQKVSFKDMTVAASTGADGKEAAFTYGSDGSGSAGDDLYFKVSDGKADYTFTVESYLCDKDSDVYKAVEGLKVGDKVDMEGFLYWYEGANPHITKVTVK